MPTVTALWPDAVPRVKFVHRVEPVAEAARRHHHIHEMREVFFEGPRALRRRDTQVIKIKFAPLYLCPFRRTCRRSQDWLNFNPFGSAII